MSSASSLSDIHLDPEDQAAWMEFLDALNVLGSDDRKVCFIRSLEIRTDQPSLTELEAATLVQLRRTFGADNASAGCSTTIIAEQLDQSRLSHLVSVAPGRGLPGAAFSRGQGVEVGPSHDAGSIETPSAICHPRQSGSPGSENHVGRILGQDGVLSRPDVTPRIGTGRRSASAAHRFP